MITPQRRQYKIPLDPDSFMDGKTVDIRGNDEVGETWVISAGESVAVKMGIVPLPGSPVAEGKVLGIAPGVGLVVDPGV